MRHRSRGKQKKQSRWNALLSWELLRVSRRTGALAIGRFAFGGALLGVMWLLYSIGYADQENATGSATEIGKQLSRFADDFALTFFFVQLIVVLLLTPIFVAGSVFEERETRSGEVLLTTDLTRREIFYGKYLARVVQVLMVVMAGAPILALTLLWGGVATEFIAISYVATFFCVFSSGAIAVSVAGGSETYREAVMKAYGYIFIFDLLIFPGSPFLMIGLARATINSLICTGVFFLAIQIGTTLYCLGYGLRWLRLAMLRQRKRVTAELAEKMAQRHPPVAEESPLLWKEKYISGQTATARRAVVALCIFVAAMMVFFVVITLTMVGGWMLEYIVPFGVFAAATMIGIGTASGVSTERQKNTLIDLFMIPGGRKELLRAKLVGAIWRAKWPLITLFSLLALAFPNGSPLVAIPLVTIASICYLYFGAMLGIWLSVRCRSALTANASWIGTVVLGLIGTFLVADAAGQFSMVDGLPTRVRPAWGSIVNPALALNELAMSEPPAYRHLNYGDSIHPLQFIPTRPGRVVPAIIGALVYAGIGWVLWMLALRRFEKEGRELG